MRVAWSPLYDMTRLPCLALLIASSVNLAACTEERPRADSASISPVPRAADSLAAALALDTTIIETENASPSDTAIAALLTRLGLPPDPKLAAARTGCELRDVAKKSDTLSSSPRVRCHMRGDDADVVIQAEVSPEGWAERLLVRDAVADSAREPLQTIELDLTEPFKLGELNLYTEDFDGDGVRELLVRNFEGATGNFGYEVWRSTPRRAASQRTR